MQKILPWLLAALALPAAGEEVGCVTTAWKLIGANHRVCVYAFDDPKVAGVTCAAVARSRIDEVVASNWCSTRKRAAPRSRGGRSGRRRRIRSPGVLSDIKQMYHSYT